MGFWIPFLVLLGIAAFYLGLALFIWVRILRSAMSEVRSSK